MARNLMIETGLANVASVRAAFRRMGITFTRAEDPESIRHADRVILPGVGAFGPAMEFLEAEGWKEALVERIERRDPTLAICLGLQILARESAESPGVRGLGLVDGAVEPLTHSLPTPQLGWNKVLPSEGSRLVNEGYAYYANSYCLRRPSGDWVAAMTDYDGMFCAALESGPVLACQFHPELSGDYGARMLQRWVDVGGGSC